MIQSTVYLGERVEYIVKIGTAQIRAFGVVSGAHEQGNTRTAAHSRPRHPRVEEVTMRSRTGLLVSAMVVLALALAVGARSLAQTGGGAAPPKTWNEVLAAAKKEGVVVWSSYAAPGSVR